MVDDVHGVAQVVKRLDLGSGLRLSTDSQQLEPEIRGQQPTNNNVHNSYGV